MSAGLACLVLLVLLGAFSARMWSREHGDQVAALHHEAEALPTPSTKSTPAAAMRPRRASRCSRRRSRPRC
jgi:hypothetical protein